MVPLGIFLLILGIALIIGEYFTASHLLVALGVVCVIGGSLLLVTTGTEGVQISVWAVLLIILVIAVLLAWAVSRIRATFHRQVTTGQEELKGKIAVVAETLDPEGTVFYEGDLWKAVSDSGKIPSGEKVLITAVRGLTLRVAKK